MSSWRNGIQLTEGEGQFVWDDRESRVIDKPVDCGGGKRKMFSYEGFNILSKIRSKVMLNSRRGRRY